jgi:hypothetical protein
VAYNRPVKQPSMVGSVRTACYLLICKEKCCPLQGKNQRTHQTNSRNLKGLEKSKPFFVVIQAGCTLFHNLPSIGLALKD